VEIDGRALAFASVLTLSTAFIFGLVPAIRGSRPNLDIPLRGSVSKAGRTFGLLPGLLVVVEVGLSLVLLVGAALMTRTFVKLHAIDPGFDPHDVLSLRSSARRSLSSVEGIQIAGKGSSTSSFSSKLASRRSCFCRRVSAFRIVAG
jgi:putative ABC transport system permease protein